MRGRPGRLAQVAFTLVELLTVIVILGMLIAMITPAVQEVRRSFKVHETQVYIRQLSGGIENFKTDIGDFPPSDGSYPTYQRKGAKVTPSSGAAGLVQCLLGYKNFNDDGKDGVGFRIVRAGKIYGPYVSQKMPITTKDKNGNAMPPVFLDAFGYPILYYRWYGDKNGNFRMSDNSSLIGNTLTKSDDPYLRDPNGTYYRQDYVLTSPGPNGKYDKYSIQNPKVDDIGNFTFYSEDSQ